MRIPRHLAELGGPLLKLFLVLVFFIHYQTIGIPGTLHSWVLVAGIAVTLPGIIVRTAQHGYSLPLDYAIVAFLASVIVLGFFANLGHSTASQLQAYLLALVCYVFVRENMHKLPDSFLPALMMWFLLINSVFIVLQFATGDFYPARYLAGWEPEFRIPSGVSDGPTKNGFLMAFALCVVFARFLLGQVRSRSRVIAVLTLGILALILSASRAGLVGFAVGAFVSWLYVSFTRKRPAIARSRRSRVLTYVVGLALMLGFVRVIVAFPQWAESVQFSTAASIVAFKLGQREDDSIGERFTTIATAIKRTKDNPVPILGAGFGVGSFEKGNEGLNLHNSYLEFLFEVGLLGFVAFAFLTTHVTRRAFAREGYAKALPILAGLAAIMGFMAFHDILRGRIFWIPLGILASLAYCAPMRRVGIAEPTTAVPTV